VVPCGASGEAEVGPEGEENGSDQSATTHGEMPRSMRSTPHPMERQDAGCC
jgi:hypothetical protein